MTNPSEQTKRLITRRETGPPIYPTSELIELSRRLDAFEELSSVHRGLREAREGKFAEPPDLSPAQPQPEKIQLKEGKWVTREGLVKTIKPIIHDPWFWKDEFGETYTHSGRVWEQFETPRDIIAPFIEQPAPQADDLEERAEDFLAGTVWATPLTLHRVRKAVVDFARHELIRELEWAIGKPRAVLDCRIMDLKAQANG